jgi:hypothetical protein
MLYLLKHSAPVKLLLTYLLTLLFIYLLSSIYIPGELHLASKKLR